jgi:hypothetical protein
MCSEALREFSSEESATQTTQAVSHGLKASETKFSPESLLLTIVRPNTCRERLAESLVEARDAGKNLRQKKLDQPVLFGGKTALPK